MEEKKSMRQGASIDIAGYVGKNAEVHTFQNGSKVTKCSIGVSRSYKNKQTDEWVKLPTSWWNVSAFGALGDELLRVGKKGTYIRVKGSADLREYTDRNGLSKVQPDVTVFEIVEAIQKMERSTPEESYSNTVNSNDDDPSF